MSNTLDLSEISALCWALGYKFILTLHPRGHISRGYHIPRLPNDAPGTVHFWVVVPWWVWAYCSEKVHLGKLEKLDKSLQSLEMVT